MKKIHSVAAAAVFSMVAPLALLLLLAVVPVSRAQDIIPESSAVAASDTEAPGDVENVKAIPGDGVLNLSWNVATDNVGVTGYKVYYGTKSVTADGGSYSSGPIEVGNVISYKLQVANGTKYYAAVTAVDASGNESENYSLEVSGTPSANLKPAADSEAPKVSKAETVDRNTVRVVFSEAVSIPDKDPHGAFTIKKDSDGALLEVKEAEMDSEDETGKSVLLTTADQEAETSYILTAGIDIKDSAGNPIISGTSDTGTFTGTALVASTENPASEQAAGPRILSVEAKDSTHLEVVFSEPMTFKTNVRDNFIVTEKDNVENILEIQEAQADQSKTVVTLTTAQQQALQYTLIVIDATNSEGQKIPLDVNVVGFTGSTGETPGTVTPPPAEQDTTPPEDVTELMAKMLKKLIVTLSWKASANTAGDLAQYMLYMSTDGINYGEGIPVGSDARGFDVTNIVPEVKYFFKLTARDQAGNESEGIITSFVLPGTGPELGLVLIGSLMAGRAWKKRRHSKK